MLGYHNKISLSSRRYTSTQSLGDVFIGGPRRLASYVNVTIELSVSMIQGFGGKRKFLKLLKSEAAAIPHKYAG